MKSLFIKNFKGTNICTVLWKGKPCWIAIQIAKLTGYEEASKAISHCMSIEEFEIGIDYEMLKGNDLKKFKTLLSSNNVEIIKFAPKIIIFYEEALYGFLQFTEKPIGIEFRKWIRREVMPQIRKTGSFTLEKSDKLESERTSNVSDSEDKLSSDVDNLSYSDFTDVKGSSNMRFSSSYKASKSSSFGFDLDKFSRFKDVTLNVKIFKELMDISGVPAAQQLIFLRSLFEESGIDLPFLEV